MRTMRFLHVLRRLRLSRLVAAVVLALAGPVGAVTWVCALSHDGTRLVCVADVASPTDDVAAPGPVSAVVNGTRFPLDPAHLHTVPLWAPPTEPEFVALLARSTICFRTPQCSVVLAPSPWLEVAVAGSYKR